MSTMVELAGAGSLAGTAVSVGALVYLHLSPTGLSPLRNAVSQYGISPYRAWYRVMTIAMGVGGAGIAVAVASGLHGTDVATVTSLIAVFAGCRMAISWFPMDAPGSSRTSTGAAHGVLAAVTFGSIAAGAIRLSKVLEASPRLDLLASTSRVLGWVMVACFAVLLLSRLGPELRRYFGATERLLYVAIIVWLIVIGIACATGHIVMGTDATVLHGARTLR